MHTNIKILGTGSYLPEKIITNELLEKSVNTDSRWIYENVGIKERRVCAINQATSDLAVIAANRALCASGLSSSNIDLIIVATATPDRKAPSTAILVQKKINAFNAVAFDVNAVCSGFLFAFSIGCQYLSTKIYRNVLIIGADTFSKVTDWDRRDSIFFGDGAGAIILSYDSKFTGAIRFRLYSDPFVDMLGFTIPGGGSEIPLNQENLKSQYFQMDGKAVFRNAVSALPRAINDVLSDSDLDISEIDLMIPHQPSIKVLRKTAELINLPFEKVMTNMEKYANTVGGTIPILLDECFKSGKIARGSKILFAAVGSGWTYGASVMIWD